MAAKKKKPEPITKTFVTDDEALTFELQLTEKDDIRLAVIDNDDESEVVLASNKSELSEVKEFLTKFSDIIDRFNRGETIEPDDDEEIDDEDAEENDVNLDEDEEDDDGESTEEAD